jgi:hypothetical protein
MPIHLWTQLATTLIVPALSERELATTIVPVESAGWQKGRSKPDAHFADDV